MPNKFFLSALLFFAATASLSALAPVPQHSVAMGDSSGIAGFIDLFGQNVLWILFGAVVLLGLSFISYVWTECAGLDKQRRSARMAS